MVTTKQNIGKIPIMKGEYQEGTTYQRLNQVTMLGSTYQSKIDGNTFAPAQLASDGSVENINTDKWIVIAVGNVSTAKKVMYDNEESGLEAGNVQGAVDEVASKLSDLYINAKRDMNIISFAKYSGYIKNSNKVSEDTNWVYSDFIPFGYIENVPYKFYSSVGCLNIAFYDIDKQLISSIRNNTGTNNIVISGTFTSPINTAFIVISTISETFRATIGNPEQYIGGTDLVEFVIDCASNRNLNAPFKTVELVNCIDKIILYGDSISSSDYDGYKIAMQKNTGVDNVYNAGFSGFTTAKLALNAQLQRIFDYAPDLIIIELGGNDVGETVGTFGANCTQPIVTPTNINDDYNGAYFIQAVDHIIRKIQAHYTKPPYIAVLTPTAQKRDNGDYSWNLHRNWVNKRNAVVECCIKNNVHCIDMFNLWNVDMNKEPSWSSPTDMVNQKGIYTMDGLHPSKEGFARMASVITSQIQIHNDYSKHFGNSLFTSKNNAEGTTTDQKHRTIFFRSADNVKSIKYRVGVYANIHRSFCAFDKDKNIIDKYSINRGSIDETYTVYFGDDIAYYSVMTLSTYLDKSEFTEYYKSAPINESASNSSKGILWLGTSIPEGNVEGESYPLIVGKRLGINVINKSLGSSFLSTGCYSRNNPISNLTSSDLSVGKCLTESIEEKEIRFREKVTDGTIKEKNLETIKSFSYENLVVPYLDKVDTVVIDHGYNDRLVIEDELIENGFDEVDWQSRNKESYIGALNFLIDKIREVNPRIRIIFSGHYQADDSVCRYVCTMQSEIAKHFGYPILDLWNYAGMNPSIYVSGTASYFNDYNKKYGTTYSTRNPDSNGNATELQINCPDMVHPHSDKTGKSIKKIGIILTKLIGGLINV